MKTLDLRTRVAATVAIACIAVVAALAITLNSASEDLEESLVDQIVSEEMDFLVRHYREFPSLVRDPGPNLQYYVVRGPEDLAGIPEKLRGLPAGMHEVDHDIEEQHVAVRIVDGIRFIVAYDAGPHELREQQFKRLVLFALAIIMVVAAALGYWTAGLLTRQITSLATRVAALDPGVPRAPLVQQGQDAEVAALAHAFDQYEARIRELIEREQEFTSNASHELRTPLTAIRTSCELLVAEPGLTDKARTRITAIAAAAERMTGQIELLLFLARSEPMAVHETVDLAECVNAAVEPWLAEIRRKALRFDNDIPAGTVITANRQALNLVLANLLRNAAQYTMTGGIRVEWAAPILTVSDTGPGVPAEQRSLLFERHYRGAASDGFGLGLAIVKRACDQCHWRIEITAAPGGGSAFRLTLA
ncbi:MAG: HAMP domain-containing histidine kinase [Burkholderiales bacterium]|nr:HAMP domain-containing histidine kinase [Burkholderiales bacterium]